MHVLERSNFQRALDAQCWADPEPDADSDSRIRSHEVPGSAPGSL